MFKVTLHIIKWHSYQIAHKVYIINGTIIKHLDAVLRLGELH